VSINQAPVDKWTAVHALSGLGVGLFGVSAPVALAGAAAYEVVEYAHEWPRGSVLFGSKRPESIANVASDLLVYGAAYWLGGRAPSKAWSAIALGAAALLAYTLMPRGLRNS
jgi:hypothetical protein